MKKILALVLAMAMVLVLAACGGNGGNSGNSGSSGNSGTPAANNNGNASNSDTSGNTGSNDDDTRTDAESDTAYIKDKGTLIVGITDFEPMDYHDNENSDEWIGFDADMAKAFAESLGVNVQFIEINWDNKVMELETKGIDAVWNGMSLTDDVMALMSTSEPYCSNSQVVVLNTDKADQYQTTDNLSELNFAAENGSAGAEALDKLGISFIAVDTQAKALMEVASGSSDACVIDLLMAGAMTGEGTSYPDLAMAVILNEEESEEYGVGFRKGSDMAGTFNDFWKTAYADGTVMKTAETYGITKNIIEK